MAEKTDRRCFLARGVLGAAGIGAAYGSIEENILLAAVQDGTAQTQQSKTPKTDIPLGSLSRGKIGNVSVSRLLIGGNLIGGWAHSRDLMYAFKLFTSYNTEAKVFETLELAQGPQPQTALARMTLMRWTAVGGSPRPSRAMARTASKRSKKMDWPPATTRWRSSRNRASQASPRSWFL